MVLSALLPVLLIRISSYVKATPASACGGGGGGGVPPPERVHQIPAALQSQVRRPHIGTQNQCQRLSAPILSVALVVKVAAAAAAALLLGQTCTKFMRHPCETHCVRQTHFLPYEKKGNCGRISEAGAAAAAATPAAMQQELPPVIPPAVRNAKHLFEAASCAERRSCLKVSDVGGENVKRSHHTAHGFNELRAQVWNAAPPSVGIKWGKNNDDKTFYTRLLELSRVAWFFLGDSFPSF